MSSAEFLLAETEINKFKSCSLPTYRASTVLFTNLAQMRKISWQDKQEWSYGLLATPTSRELELQLSRQQGSKYSLLYPSGLMAITQSMLALLKSGDDLLMASNCYSPGCDFAEGLKRFGVSVRYFDPLQIEQLAAKIQKNTRLICLETPGSISMELADVTAICKLARENNIITLLDNTWSAGVYFDALAHGADIVMQALTKYHSGGSDILMGSLSTNSEEIFHHLKHERTRSGVGVSADDCFLLARSLPSLTLRLAAHAASGFALAEYLQSRPEIVAVLHPALPSCPGHEFWLRDFTGGGGLFSVVFSAQYSVEKIDQMIESLQLFKIGYSWGGVQSLVMPYDMKAIRKNWPPISLEKIESGVLVRFYAGLESVSDLITDLENALSTLL